MKRTVLLFLFSFSVLSAQMRHAAVFHENPALKPKSALVDPNDRVFPDIASGGGWETILTFINMSTTPASFTVTFYDDTGSPLRLPLVNMDGSISRFASVNFALDGNTSSELVIANVDSTVTSGWSYLSFPSNTAPIAGMAVVRTKDSNGNVINESTEALSNTQDFDFFTPFDNLEGVQTALVLVNPATSTTANVRISAQDGTGYEILRDHQQIPPGARMIIPLADTYNALAAVSGKLRVTADTNRLSAVCYRTSPAGSLAYAPIFNWSGLFQ